MAALPLVMMAASAAVSAYGAISAGNANAASAKSQQAADNYNATVDKENANAAESAASANEMAMRRQNDQVLARQRAGVAESAGGFTGTNVGVLNQNGANLELNALNERYKGQMESRGLLADANLDEYQADVAGANAKTAKTAGYIGAASSILSSASNYSNFRGMNMGYGG